jgi:hypothetical protein
MQTEQWSFFAGGARVFGEPSGDEELELSFVSVADFVGIVARGELSVASQAAAVAVAAARGLVPL